MIAILLLCIFCTPALAIQATSVTPLFQGVIDADLAQVQAAVSSGANVNQRGVVYSDGDFWERTPLILAAHMGQADVVKYLLQHGANVNARGRISRGGEKFTSADTAINKAAYRGHDDVIRALVTYGKGIDINAKNKEDGFSALMFMARYEHLNTTQFLIDHGASITIADSNGNNVLVQTIKNKSRATLNYLISKGADSNHMNKAGETTLMLAIGGSERDIDFEFAQYFLTKNPNVNLQRSQNGRAAIHVAASTGIVRAGKLLLDNGANIDLRDTTSKITPLFYSVIKDKKDMVEFLLKRGAKTEIEDKFGNTVIMTAASEVQDEIITMLVKSGAESNKRSKSNVVLAPLTTLAGSPNSSLNSEALKAMEAILDHGGDVDFKNGQGLTALMSAARKPDNSDGYSRAQFLIKRGAQLNLVNNKGETALMLAAGAGNDRLVKYLIKQGADPKIKSGAGETVANYAKRGGSSTSYLESQGVKAVAPTIKKAVIVKSMVGTWTGYQAGLPQAFYTVILRNDGTYSFNSELSDAVWKQIPASARKAMKRTIAAHKGKYTVNSDVLVWHPVGLAPTSMHWEIAGGRLILDDKIRLKK